MPPNPKRRATEPVTDEAVLQADDPRPQRVAQLPANSTGARRTLKKVEEHIPTSVFDTEADQEMQAEYGVTGAEYKPAFLYVERGPGAGQLLEVKQGTVIVGRASVSDLRLQHPSISRRHTQFKRVGEQFFVKDLGSQNGTFVNKQRIGGEVEVKPGDSIAMGNAVLRLRGPLNKGEAPVPGAEPSPAEKAAVADKKARVATAVVARPSGPNLSKPPSSTALKVAVFAGAVGFSLAAVLAFALVKSMTPSKKEEPSQVTKAAVATPSADDERERLINEALKRKMAEQDVKAEPAVVAQPDTDVVVEEAVTVKEQAKAPSVTRAPVAPAPTRVATAKKATSSKAAANDDEEASSSAGSGNRTSILAPYEKGNAGASLDLAIKAGDKDLSDKLMRFIAAYDAANDAVAANNGSAAITNFQKALTLDEGLSSGWGKYGGEIRKQLSNLYTLLGTQYAKAGDAAKAKTSFQAALKHNPQNATAKEQLAQLGGDVEPTVAAPKPKAAPVKKSTGNSIDDAFDE